MATIVGTDGTELSHIVLPAETLTQFEHVEHLQARLDNRLNTLWERFKEWSFNDAPEALVNALPAKPSASKLAQLYLTTMPHLFSLSSG